MPTDDYIDWPVDIVRITPHGAYQYDRGTSVHQGIDLAAPRGTMVKAPEDGTITDRWENDTTKPFSGYGPGGLLMRGKTSGVYYLLGHLDPKAWGDAPWDITHILRPAPGDVVQKGQLLGKTSALNHVHFEVRTKRMWQPPERHEDIIVDPKQLVEQDVIRAPAPEPASDEGSPWLLLLAIAGGLYLVSKS